MAALPLIAAAALLKVYQPQFTASARLSADAAQVSGSAPSSIALIAKSQPVLNAVIADAALAPDVATAAGAPLPRRISAMLDRIRGQPPQPVTAEALQVAIAARQASETVTDIAVTSPNADGAMRIANAVAKASIDALQQAGQPRDATLDALRQRIAQAEAALATARSQAAAARAAMDPVAQKAQMQARAAEAKARFDAIQTALGSGRDIEAVAEMIRTPGIDRLRQEVRDARARAPQQVNEKLQLLTEAVRLAVAAARADWQALTAAAQSGEMPPGGLGDPSDATITALERGLAEAQKAYADRLAATGARPSAVKLDKPATDVVASGPDPALVWTLAVLLAAAMFLLVLWRAARRAASRKVVAPLPPFPRAMPPEKPADAAHDSPQPSEPLQPSEPQAPPVAAASAAPEAVPAPEERRAPMSIALRKIASGISEKGWSTALQTVLVTSQDSDAAAEACLSLVFGLARHNMRVILLDADEDKSEVSRILRDAPVSGYLTLNGKRRMLCSFQSSSGAPVWFVPAEKTLKTTPPIELPMIVPGVAGHFDVLVMAGAPTTAKGTAALAQAADQVIVIGPATGLVVDAAKLVTIDDSSVSPATPTSVLKV